MRMWQLELCFPFSLLYTFITNVNISSLVYRRHASLSKVEEDKFLNLCEHKVHIIKNLANNGNLLNKRQCSDLSDKLSKTFKNVKELVLYCEASSTVSFRPALENLYRILEKAKSLVSNCCDEDWCTSSVYQFQNERAFQEILLELELCYSTIFEQAKSTREEWNSQVEDLRGSPTFQPAAATDIDEDNQMLKKRFEDLGSERHLSILDCFLPGKLGLKQSLAQYLLSKWNCISQSQPQSKDEDKCSEILWTEDTGSSGTWAEKCHLGAGAGAQVWRTKWLGIPCAKKVFKGINISGNETCILLKEARILASLNHPHVVKFFCCGCEEKTGDGFIAMELMEMSLFDLIREQTKPFPLPVALDIIMQIARGMRYLHEVGVAHRDLKSQNVVVNKLSYPHLEHEYYFVKLVDFGLSKTKVELHRAHTISHVGIGTTIYRAPEVHPQANPDRQGRAFWFKADVYSFAVTCSEILSRQQPYKSIQRFSDLYEKLINGVRPELPMETCPPELASLLTDCWNLNPRSRPSFRQICSSLEAISQKVIRMKMEKPSVQRQFVAVTDHQDVELQSRGGALMLASGETIMGRSPAVAFSPGSTLDGPSKEVNSFIKDPHKDAQALENGLSKKLATVPSSNGEISCQAPKSKVRGNNNKTGLDKKAKGEDNKTGVDKKAKGEDNKTGVDKKAKGEDIKTGVDKKAKGEEKKVIAEAPLHQSNSDEGKKMKEPSGRKVVDSNTQTGSARKRGKRKQALDDPTAGVSTTATPTGKSRNEVPNKELKKRPRRDDRKPGESYSSTEAWTLGANGSLPEDLARTLSEERGFDLESHSWHITSFSDRDGKKIMTVEFNVEPTLKKPGRNTRKNPRKSRVKSISSGCSRIG